MCIDRDSKQLRTRMFPSQKKESRDIYISLNPGAAQLYRRITCTLGLSQWSAKVIAGLALCFSGLDRHLRHTAMTFADHCVHGYRARCDLPPILTACRLWQPATLTPLRTQAEAIQVTSVSSPSISISNRIKRLTPYKVRIARLLHCSNADHYRWTITRRDLELSCSQGPSHSSNCH